MAIKSFCWCYLYDLSYFFYFDLESPTISSAYPTYKSLQGKVAWEKGKMLCRMIKLLNFWTVSILTILNAQ